MGKKIKKMVITTGIVGLMLFGMTGCSKGEVMETSAPVQTEATTEADLDVRINLETTEVDVGDTTIKAEVYETDAEGGFVGKTEDGEIIASMGKYGEYGKEAYDLLKFNWENRIYEDETELRENAPIILGSISEENLEIIIQELLSLDRGQNPSQETTQSESLTETKPVESTKVPEPTQAPQPEPTQAVEPETKQAEPQQTTPSPQPQVNNTPPAAISEEEADAIWDQAAKDLGLGEEVDASTKVTISDGISVDPEDNQGWNWH